MEGDHAGRYRKDDGKTDRSKMLAALVTSFISRGWQEKHAYSQLIDPANRGGAKLQEIKRRDGKERASAISAVSGANS